MDELGEWVRRLFVLPATLLAKIGVTPNMVTVSGVVVSIGAAWVLGHRVDAIGGLGVLLVGVFDGLDGALARVAERKSRLGAFLDSTFDRLSDALLYFGLLVYFTRYGSATSVFLTYLGALNSQIISYIRARAEAVGYESGTGLFNRPIRLAILTLGLLLDQSVAALWILAIGTGFTVIQRLAHTVQTAQRGD